MPHGGKKGSLGREKKEGRCDKKNKPPTKPPPKKKNKPKNPPHTPKKKREKDEEKYYLSVQRIGLLN